jgi:hypothetical protein
MIVRPLADGSLILITQNDHAKLSGLFAARWGGNGFEPLHLAESVTRAAMFHDCGWSRYETAPIYDATTKTTPGFTQVPLDGVQLEAFQNALDWMTSIDPYSGLLISRHRTGLWRGRYGAVQQPKPAPRRAQSASVESFVALNEGRQEAALAELDRNVFAVNYQLLQIFDLLSLYLCTAEPTDERFEFVPSSYSGDGTNGVSMGLKPIDSRTINLDPFPFTGSRLHAGLVYRHLPTSDYPNEMAFRQAYFEAELKLMSFEFV